MEEKHENFIAAERKREMLAATKVKMSGSEKKVSEAHLVHTYKRVARKFPEVSRCSRAKQRQRNVPKKCAASAKLFFAN